MIEKPDNPHWNERDIGWLIKELTETGQIHGGYGEKVSKDMVEILNNHMIHCVSTDHGALFVFMFSLSEIGAIISPSLFSFQQSYQILLGIAMTSDDNQVFLG